MVWKFVVLYTMLSLGKSSAPKAGDSHNSKLLHHPVVVSQTLLFSTTLESPPAIARIPGHKPVPEIILHAFLINILLLAS